MSEPPSHQRNPINLGKPSLRARLEAYYSLISPSVLKNKSEWRSKFDQIYDKFGGSYKGERKLALKLSKKYGDKVRLLLAESVSEAKSRQIAVSQEATQNIQDDANFDIRGKGSGDLNFLSDFFDPVAALSSSETQVCQCNPSFRIEDSPILDTVSQFAYHLPMDDPLRREAACTRVVPLKDCKSGKKEEHPFDEIALSFDSGPISVLSSFRRRRIRVLVRYVNAIRGTITGTLVAFDKHMNMVMRDVEEHFTWRPVNEIMKSNVELEVDRRRRMANDIEPESSTDWGCKHRFMKQILVRGDCVVTVNLIEEDRKISSSSFRQRHRSPTEEIKKASPK